MRRYLLVAVLFVVTATAAQNPFDVNENLKMIDNEEKNLLGDLRTKVHNAKNKKVEPKEAVKHQYQKSVTGTTAQTRDERVKQEKIKIANKRKAKEKLIKENRLKIVLEKRKAEEDKKTRLKKVKAEKERIAKERLKKEKVAKLKTKKPKKVSKSVPAIAKKKKIAHVKKVVKKKKIAKKLPRKITVVKKKKVMTKISVVSAPKRKKSKAEAQADLAYLEAIKEVD